MLLQTSMSLLRLQRRWRLERLRVLLRLGGFIAFSNLTPAISRSSPHSCIPTIIISLTVLWGFVSKLSNTFPFVVILNVDVPSRVLLCPRYLLLMVVFGNTMQFIDIHAGFSIKTSRVCYLLEVLSLSF